MQTPLCKKSVVTEGKPQPSPFPATQSVFAAGIHWAPTVA